MSNKKEIKKLAKLTRESVIRGDLNSVKELIPKGEPTEKIEDYADQFN